MLSTRLQIVTWYPSPWQRLSEFTSQWCLIRMSWYNKTSFARRHCTHGYPAEKISICKIPSANLLNHLVTVVVQDLIITMIWFVCTFCNDSCKISAVVMVTHLGSNTLQFHQCSLGWFIVRPPKICKVLRSTLWQNLSGWFSNKLCSVTETKIPKSLFHTISC